MDSSSVVLLTCGEAARVLGVTRSCLAKWRMTRKGVAFVRLGKAVRYRRQDLDAFVEANMVAVAAGSKVASSAKGA